MSPSKLEDLLVNEDDLNEEQLTEVVAPYAQIGDRSGAFVPTDEFYSLSALQQTAVVLLFRKAAHALDLAEEEGAGPMEIAEESGLNHSTVKGNVRELDELGLVQNDDGVYSIPAYSYDGVRDLIEDE